VPNRILHEGDHLVEHGLEPADLLGIRVLGHAADHDTLVVRNPASEDGAHVLGSDLDLQGVEIVLDGHGDDLGIGHREVVRLVPGSQGIGVSPLDQTDHLVLDGEKILVLAGVVGDGHDIQVIQRREMIEVDDVIVEVLGPHDQVADQPPSVGDLGAEGIVQSRCRRHGVHREAHAAEAAGDITGVPGVLAREQGLEATGHGAAAPGVFDLTVLELHLDLEMTLDPGYGINCNSLAH
jgi:hypothetical protein